MFAFTNIQTAVTQEEDGRIKSGICWNNDPTSL